MNHFRVGTIVSNFSCMIREQTVSLSIRQQSRHLCERIWRRRLLLRRQQQQLKYRPKSSSVVSPNKSSSRQSHTDSSQHETQSQSQQEQVEKSSSYFVMVPGSTILPSTSLLESLQIPPPSSTITFQQPQRQQPTNGIFTDIAATAAVKTDPSTTTTTITPTHTTPKESITISDTEELPVILFQSNRLLMVDKPAGWSVPILIKPKTLDEITKPKEPAVMKRVKKFREIPYLDTDIPWEEHPDNPDNPISLEQKSQIRMLMKTTPSDPLLMMNNIIKNITNNNVLRQKDNNTTEEENVELQLIQQHLENKEIRKREQQYKEKMQRVQYNTQLSNTTYSKKQMNHSYNNNGLQLPSNHLERVRAILNTASIDIHNDNNNNSNTKNDNNQSSKVHDRHPTSPDVVSYLSNVKYSIYRQDRIKHTNIVSAHGMDPTTSGLVLFGTGPKCKNRFRTIYNDGYKCYYAILQPMSNDKLRNDVRARIECHYDYPYTWNVLDGYMLEQSPRTDEVYPHNRVPTQIFIKQHDIDRLQRNVMTKNRLWYCSLEYRVVPHPRYSSSNDNNNNNNNNNYTRHQYICLEIKAKQVGHEVIRALLSTYQLHIFGDMKYGAKDPDRYVRQNSNTTITNDQRQYYYEGSDEEELEPIFPMNDNNNNNNNNDNNSSSYYRTSRHDGANTIDLGLHGRIPLHCSSIQCRPHIHLGPQASLNVLHRTVISAPIPSLWESYFDWTWDDIQVWEQSCIDCGIEAA